ncbi:putative basic proline-rich protein-like isoform X1 [Iris pallida]|uniref:Basic proline-rich protein-like isoform X1 n=1 Tax=Iris pallida TaxID=29817 RepID=A0AAX6G3N8_IRIPA|nr:putative basic proline-rich protein-like isoform X1 [Iris pallida]
MASAVVMKGHGPWWWLETTGRRSTEEGRTGLLGSWGHDGAIFGSSGEHLVVWGCWSRSSWSSSPVWRRTVVDRRTRGWPAQVWGGSGSQDRWQTVSYHGMAGLAWAYWWIRLGLGFECIWLCWLGNWCRVRDRRTRRGMNVIV